MLAPALALACLIVAAPPGRVPWTTSRVAGSPEPPPAFRAAVAFPKLKFDHPLLIVRIPGTDRLVVGEQDGRLWSFRNRPDAERELFLDLRKEIATVGKHPGAKEIEFVYGLAFHPKFRENRQCFVCYTLRGKKNEKNLPDGSRVSRFRVTSGDVPRIDPASEEILLTFPQGGHNGGDLHFGPDGMLYISTGDAADPNPPDPFKTGQDITDLLSSILRIDVDHADPGKAYRVPNDNPFVGVAVRGKPARPEVWAYGFRNPWRMSFDRKTGELYAGDVGWETWEMVHRVEKGGNYGWSVMEARQAVNTSELVGPTPIKPPLIELNHADAASVTGGYLYRGAKFPELVGTYIFGDWETRRIWSAKFANGELAGLIDLAAPTVRVVAFGEDEAGELYFLDYDAGTVHTLERNTAAAFDPAEFPRTLSATGIFADVKHHALAPGVYPYSVAEPMWQDFAIAEHFVGLPNTSAITDHPQKKPMPGNVNWHNFRYHPPAGAVFGKTLSLELTRGDAATRTRLETQVLHFDGENWRGYTYRWRDDGSDADLVPADGAERQLTVKDPHFAGGVRHQTWTFAGRAQCLQCHNAWAEYTLGFSVEQLNRDVPTPDGPKNQLAHLADLGLLKPANGKPITPAKEPKLPADPARVYLHANCGHCHRFGGGGAVNLELHATADLSKLVLGATPTRGTFDLPGAKIVAPGDPGRSVLLYRMAKFGTGRMPHLGSEFPDVAGCETVKAWILAGGKPPIDRPLGIDAALAAGRGEKPGLLAAAAKLPPGGARDLLEGYLPQPAERKLGTNPRPKSILSLAGDPAAGEKLFFQPSLTCATCHQVGGKGTAVGPNLSDVGAKRTREFLLESLLDPSRRVEQAFQAYSLKTADGQSFNGLLVRKDAAEVVVKDAQNKEHRVPAADVESLSPSRTSLMPDGLLRDMTPQQAADLLAYLAARKDRP